MAAVKILFSFHMQINRLKLSNSMQQQAHMRNVNNTG